MYHYEVVALFKPTAPRKIGSDPHLLSPAVPCQKIKSALTFLPGAARSPMSLL